MLKKRGQMWEALYPWIIGILVLALVLFFYAILTGKLGSIAEVIKNFLRFGQ